MGKTVEKIVINTESINIVSVENGVNSIVHFFRLRSTRRQYQRYF